MYDPTPPPFGDVTRRWTQLTDGDRDQQTSRLVSGPCSTDHLSHVDRPVLDEGACYWRLVPSAVAGDEIAVGWLATTHRPLLLARGRALFESDPGEWGGVCLEILHTTIAKADLSEVRWLRRRVAERMASRLSRLVAAHLDRRRRERPTEPSVLRTRRLPAGDIWESHLELGVALDRALDELDPPTRDALVALANETSVAAVADRYGLTHAAVRQRVSRARRRLRPELAAYHRSVVS